MEPLQRSYEVSDTLTCPLWVLFIDPFTSKPYLYNVQTHEKASYEHEMDTSCQADEDLAPEESAIEQAEHLGVAEPGAASPVNNKDLLGDVQPVETLYDSSAMQSRVWMLRPARVQVANASQVAGYVQGNEDFNIWYGKYESDRFDPKEREPSSTQCDPKVDEGYTQADLTGSGGDFCIFFARGCCNLGHQCKYYHHVPTLEEGIFRDEAHDIFGRLRYSHHRDDMGGVGSFNSDCRTIFVGDLRFDRARHDTIQTVEQEIWDAFGQWGRIERVRLMPAKAISFVTYRVRASAEFAKVAMDNQKLGLAACIRVRWAMEDRNPRAVERARAERSEIVQAAVDHRQLMLELLSNDWAPANQRPSPSDVPLLDPGAAEEHRVEGASTLVGSSTSASDESSRQAILAVTADNVHRMCAALVRADSMLVSLNELDV